MYDNKNQSDGAIYTNNYKQNDKQPDWTGKVEISRDMLKELVSIVKEGGTGELRVALWNRTSKNGNEYKYARLDIPQNKEEPKKEPVEDKADDVETFTDDDIPFWGGRDMSDALRKALQDAMKKVKKLDLEIALIKEIEQKQKFMRGKDEQGKSRIQK